MSQILDSWRNQAAETLEDGFRELLRSVDNVLMDFADKAENINVQNHFFDAQRQVLLKREDMQSEFHEALWQSLDSSTSFEQRPTPVPGQEKLALLNKEVYEKSLALQTLTDHAERHNYQQLYALSQRIAVVTDREAMEFEDLPASPKKITQVFSKSMNHLSIESDAQLVLYTLYDKYVLHRLTEVYDQLNESFVEAGVLPLLKYKLKKSESSGMDARTPSTPVDTTQSATEEMDRPLDPPVALADETMGRICSLLAATRAKNNPPRAPLPEGVSAASNAEVISAFNSIETAPTTALPREIIYGGNQEGGEVVQVNKEFLKRVRNVLVQQRQGVKQAIGHDRLNDIQEDVIDVVGLLFENMLDDPVLNGMVKALLGHLHTPYIKFALKNPEFLSDQKHPARLFFNQSVDGAGIWVDENDLEGGIYPLLKEIVGGIVRKGKPETHDFNEYQRKMSETIKTLESKANNAENRSTEAEKGRAKLEYTKDLAHKTTEQIFGGQEITLECKRFVDGVWQDYLILVLLRDRGNAAWKKAESLGNQILILDQKAANGISTPEEIEVLSARVMEEIGSLLPHKSSMIDRFLDSLKRSGAATIAMAMPSPSEEDQEVDESLKDICNKLRDLPKNTWFEFKPAGTRKYRAKLSWYNPHSDNFLFVSNSGQKVALKEISRLAQEVSDGFAVIIPQREASFFDRAMKNIKTMLESAAANRPEKREAS